MFEVFLFTIGCALLFFGANWLVHGAAALATGLRISKSVVGLTLVALGTSAPELFVNLIAAYHGKTEFALANVSGSNLVNLCVGFGICGLTAVVAVNRPAFAVDLTLLLVTPVLVFVLFFFGPSQQLPFWSWIPLTLLLVYYGFSLHRRSRISEFEDAESSNVAAAIAYFLLGGVCLYAGGQCVLEASVKTAAAMGISEDVIGLTIVAFGTSIPDVTASVVAARRGEFSIAIGNILGSNISNIVLVLNGTILVSQSSLTTNPLIIADYAAVCFVSLIFLAASFRYESITRPVAVLLLLAYTAYMAVRLFLSSVG